MSWVTKLIYRNGKFSELFNSCPWNQHACTRKLAIRNGYIHLHVDKHLCKPMGYTVVKTSFWDLFYGQTII